MKIAGIVTPRALVLTAVAVLGSCTGIMPAANSAQSPSPTPTQSVAHYDVVELFTLDLEPVDIAVSESQVLVAVMDIGGRPSDVRSRVVAAPLSGGRADVIAGSETPRGTGILGLTYKGALYLSLSSDQDARRSGVFRLTSGQLVPVAGGNPVPNPGGTGDGGPAAAAILQQPQGLAFSNTDDLYVAEYADSRVRVVRANIIETYAGDGTCRTERPQSGKATSTSVCSPGLVAVDANGVVYVAQRAGATWIARIEPTGTLTAIGGTFSVGGMAVIDGRDLLAVDATNGIVVRFRSAAIGVPPEVLASGLGAVRGVAVGDDGSIYLARSRGASSGSARVWTVIRLRPAP